MVYDSIRQIMVAYNGADSSIWEFNGLNWAGPISPTPRPTFDYFPGVAFDPVRNRVVVFGKLASSGACATYTWDGANWTDVSPTNQPPSSASLDLVYDPARSVFIKFGGIGSGGALQQMWQ